MGRERLPCLTEYKVHPKSGPCPVCGEQSLLGCAVDLPADKIEYSKYFLPVVRAAEFDPAPPSNQLIFFDNYFCPNDLFVYSGRITINELAKGTQYNLDPNVFYKMYVYFNPDRELKIGRRLAFFFASLRYAGIDIESLLPPVDAAVPRRDALGKLLNHLLEMSVQTTTSAEDEERQNPLNVFKILRTIQKDFQWNPLQAAGPFFYQSYGVIGAVLELQLADLLYLHRRSQIRGAQTIPFDDLYEALDRYRRFSQAEKSLDEDLAGNILFQCLKMSEVFHDSRRIRCLLAAHAICEYLVKIKSRVGGDVNRNLDKLAANPDVMFYLYVRLSRDLGVESATEQAVLRLLERRLGMIADYSMPHPSQESARTMRIGAYLRQFVAELKQNSPGNP